MITEYCPNKPNSNRHWKASGANLMGKRIIVKPNFA